MAKKGRDEQLEKLTADWLKEHDKTPPRKRDYKSDRQMLKKSIKECSISNLNKKQLAEMENKYYSIITGDDSE
jgi:hypothetical protein